MWLMLSPRLDDKGGPQMAGGLMVTSRQAGRPPPVVAAEAANKPNHECCLFRAGGKEKPERCSIRLRYAHESSTRLPAQ
jgi:hypothetical protein